MSGGKSTFRLVSADHEEEPGLATLIAVNVAAGDPEKLDLHIYSVCLSACTPFA